ncbi:hypothetical protein PV327_005103 [Microctonus hyperodae]|uniref:Uncharacterized protein n=1 Tax=Microctonus hyperodae TaxID=165561 RepID=A0AA39G247_MICHY|nr:hypothetical protein PV327_005103 [Microctonus hyperodae]
MDYHNILRILTTKKSGYVDLDQNIEMLLHEVFSQLPEHFKQDIEINCCKAEDTSIRRKYLQTIIHVLYRLERDVLSASETFMSVNEHRVVKVAIELIIAIGIIPCLLPGIGASINKLCSNAANLPQESLTATQKYNRLVVTAKLLTDLSKEISLKPAIITQLGPLLGALLQLAHAPLMKPTNINIHSSDFHMTDELYNKLLNDQAEFKVRLNDLIKNCQLSAVMKELMVLSGMEGAPKWLKRITRSYVAEAIVEPTGIMSLISAICEDTLDIGKHWNKINTISQVIATSYSKDPEQYFNAVCKQLLNILTSKNIKHAANIAVSCITTLYEIQPKICVEKIFRVIAAPLKIIDNDYTDNPQYSVIKSESDLSNCIENLVKCFVRNDGKFQILPNVLLHEIALPLFHIQCKAYSSASSIKSKIRELLIHMLANENSRDNLFSVFLEHELHTGYFGETLCFGYGSQGGIEIQKKPNDFEFIQRWTVYGDALLDLVKSDENLSLSIVKYLFKWLLISHENNLKVKRDNSDEFYNYLMKMICQQEAAGTILSELGTKTNVQKSLFESPEPLLSFVTALYPKNVDPAVTLSVDYTSLYTGLMLVKVIVTEGASVIDWTPFNHFSDVLKIKLELEFPSNLLDLTREVINIIKVKGTTPRFQDLSVGDKNKEDFEKAMRDLTDPLLPVRGHGLMAMTKLIESSNPVAIAKKDLVLCLFRENLKDEDSFIYLSAINGLCAMAVSFPQEIIELLIEEFVNMPQRNKNNEIAPENRAKLGEILVKTTRALGEMASVYKNNLLNGFLCGVRDSDPIVRTSSLSCLGELCKILGFRIGDIITEVLYCIGCIIQTDKSQECRRAAVLVITLLIRGVGKDALTNLASELLPVYRGLKYLRDNDKDDVLRLHAQLALEEIDDIVQNVLFTKPALEKNIFLLP